MSSISRRSFVTQATAGFAALSALGVSADAQRVYTTSDWKVGSFDQLIQHRAQVKQLYDVTKIEDGNFLLHIKNSLDGLQFGFGIPADQIKIVGAIRGDATIVCFDDYAWEKYQLGKLGKIKDPKTKKPASRNLYYPSDAGNPPKYASQDPNSDKSMFQDTSIQALEARGVQFLCCHMATEGLAGYIIKKQKLTQKHEEVVQDLQSHVLPGVMIVPSMVASITLLQSKGQFTYLYV